MHQQWGEPINILMQLVKDNYYWPSGAGAEFTVNVSPLPRVFDNFFKESILAAEEIQSQRVGKLHLMYSGGVDSENVLNVFLHLGIPIVPVIIKMTQGYNDYDIQYAFDFCQKHQLLPLVVDVDFDHFVQSGKMLEVAKICKTSIYHRALTAYVAGQLDGTVICGDGEPYIKLIKETKTWNVHMDEHEFAVYNYFVNKGIHGTTHFNSYRPEMMSAMFTDPLMQDLANNRCPGKEGSNSSKCIMYNRHSGFNMTIRPKYTGYEKIEKSEIFKNAAFDELAEAGKPWTGIYSVDYHKFLKEHNL